MSAAGAGVSSVPPSTIQWRRPMKRLALRVLLLVAASVLAPLEVHAQLFRAYVASYGNDANPCTVASPCRLLPAALNAVADKGQIWMLDSANFNAGTVNVTKSVKIEALPGQIASIVPVGGVPAMIISPDLTVSLRNISMVTNANNPGTDGIQMTTGVLSVEDSVFEVVSPSRTVNAIFVDGAGTVSVHHSLFRNGGVGIWVQGDGKADVSGSKFFDLATAGVFVSSGVAGTKNVANVRDSYFSGGFTSVWSQGDGATSSSRITVVGCSTSNMQIGVLVQVVVQGGTAVLTVGNSTITGNTLYGMFNGGSGGTFETLGNNVLRGNGTASVGPITTITGS